MNESANSKSIGGVKQTMQTPTQTASSTESVDTSNWKTYYNNNKIFFEIKYPSQFQAKTGEDTNLIINGGNVFPKKLEDNDIIIFDDNYPWGMKVVMGIIAGRARDSANGVFLNSDLSRKFYGREKDITINGHDGVTLLESDFDEYGVTYIQGASNFTVYFVPEYIETEKYSPEEQMKIYKTMIESIKFLF